LVQWLAKFEAVSQFEMAFVDPAQEQSGSQPGLQWQPPICEIYIPVKGCLVVHLNGYGWINVFRTVGTNRDSEYWATTKMAMSIE